MGQKVNPIGFRLKITNDWLSNWYSSKKVYPLYVLNDVKIRGYIAKNLSHAMISKVFISRKDDLIEVIIHSAKPGVIIGKKGADIDKIRFSLEKLVDAKVKLDILEVKIVETDAVLIANNIAYQLKKRMSYRRVIKKAMQSALSYGVKGIRIGCSGRLNGVEIARTEWYKEGRIPLHTLRANIEYSCAEVKTTYGIIGIKVLIYKGDKKL
ncbi:MAG: 30S ribosomal protein S3 [Rickettsiaceae bacterium H1]|nr:30S ribosomal protein S3 [Rickettsiaceae bacterium H1]